MLAKDAAEAMQTPLAEDQILSMGQSTYNPNK